MSRESLIASPSTYRQVVTMSGVPIKCAPSIKGWNGWPDDVRETLQRWNRGSGHRLSFYGLEVWGGYATGLKTLTKKCTECGDFFNQPCAGWFDRKRWVCDDCLIVLARAAQAEAAA